jgi:endo-1,4-beta-xylanase
MKKSIRFNCFLFFIITIPSFLLAQEDAYHLGLRTMLNTKYGITGGAWIFNPNESSNASAMSGGGGTRSIENITGQLFTRATQLSVSTVPGNVWDASLQLATIQAITSGDRILLIFWARAISGVNNIVLGNFLFQRNESPWTKFSPMEQRVGSQWKQYILPLTVNASLIAGKGKFMVELGAAVQTIQIAGVAAINYKQAYPLASMPTVSNDEYLGMEANAPWRDAAKARIEQYRKANLDLVVLDANDQAIPNAQVTIEMLRHEYAFGTAISEGRVLGSNPDPKYKAMLLNLDGKGHGFSEIVFENGHKWRAWEENYAGGSKENKVDIVKWFTDNRIRVRGHTLHWPSWSNSASDVQGLRTNLPALKTRVFNRIDEMLNYPGMKGIITDWDVLNEFTGNVDIANAFRGSTGYPTGREIYTEIFNYVDQIAPETKKYVNEAHLTNIYVKENLFKSYVQQMVAEGSKNVNVGFQAHFRYMIPPEEWYQQMDVYHNITGGLVKITEYDNKTFASDELEGAYFRDLLTIHFSHPYSDGFIMWGFWDGAHYAGRAPLFDINWNLKPEGKPFIDLVFGEWWTPTATLTPNTLGQVSQRGFKGDYKITIKVGTQKFEEVVTLKSDMKITYKQPFTAGLGVSEFKNDKVLIYPNPTNSFFTVESSKSTFMKVKLINMNGQVVKELASKGQNLQVDVNNLPTGIYMIQVVNQNGTSNQRLIIK